MPDNFSQWEAHEAEMERRRESRPVCRRCGKHIQDDHYYFIEGCNFCEDCMKERHLRFIEDFYA